MGKIIRIIAALAIASCVLSMTASAQQIIPGVPAIPGAPAVPSSPGAPAVRAVPSSPGSPAAPGASPQARQSPPPAVQPAVGDCAATGPAMARSISDSVFSPTRPQAPQRPPSQARKACEGGRIQVMVGAERPFGHRIMDHATVTVLILADPGVVFDLQSLARGTITFNGQEFDLASPVALNWDESPVSLHTRRTPDGRVLARIDLVVQSAVPPSVAPFLVFRLDLRYALGVVRDAAGNVTAAPDWRVMSTPEIALTMSSTAQPGDQLAEPELEEQPAPLPWPTFPLLVAGFLLILGWPAYKILRWYHNWRARSGRRKALSAPQRPEVALAQSLDQVMRAGAVGYTEAQYRQIICSLREYLGLQSATYLEARRTLTGHPSFDDIMFAWKTCDEVLYAGRSHSTETIARMERSLIDIVTRAQAGGARFPIK